MSFIEIFIFLNQKQSCPYIVNRSVWTSALNASMLYSCETWLTMDFRAVEKVYMSSLKQLLGVRHSTRNSIVLLESGKPDVKTLIKNRQHKFPRNIVSREQYPTSYLNKVFSIAMDSKSPMGLQLMSYLTSDTYGQNTTTYMDTLKQNILSSEKTRDRTYVEIKPLLSACTIYSNDSCVPENTRIAVTRIRLSSHRLRIETGRWTRTPP